MPTGRPTTSAASTSGCPDFRSASWLMATGEDLRYPTTEGGERTLQLRLTHRYLDRVIGAAIRDKTVGLVFGKVAQLVAPPTTLFRPGILLRALLHGGAR